VGKEERADQRIEDGCSGRSLQEAGTDSQERSGDRHHDGDSPAPRMGRCEPVYPEGRVREFSWAGATGAQLGRSRAARAYYPSRMPLGTGLAGGKRVGRAAPRSSLVGEIQQDSVSQRQEEDCDSGCSANACDTVSRNTYVRGRIYNWASGIRNSRK
jgi:hypothetical protein